MPRTHPALPGKPLPPSREGMSGAALSSLIVGIAGFLTILFPISGVATVICAHVAFSTFKKNPQMTGKGFAIAGFVIGYLQIVATLIIAGVIWFGYTNRVKIENSAQRNRVESLELVDVADAVCHVVLPKGHNPADPIPVAIWLHGYGASPMEISLFKEDYQARANELKVAFVGISATAAMGEGSYEWTENLELDYKYLLDVLAKNKDKIKPKWPKVALFGFSQGARVAGDLAMNYPDKFSGAILMSAGGNRIYPEEPRVPEDANALQHYYCFVGEEEAYGNVSLTNKYKKIIKGLGASIEHKEYPGMKDHTLPPDFEKNLSKWINRILWGE